MVSDAAVESKALTAISPVSDEAKRDAKSLFDIIGNASPVIPDEILGSGFTVVQNKDRLTGVAGWVTDWTFNKGDQGEFVSLEYVVGPDVNGLGDITGKFIVNDGGTGIYDQMTQIQGYFKEKHPFFVPEGLRRSDYEAGIGRDGKQRPAGTTYYLDFTAKV